MGTHPSPEIAGERPPRPRHSKRRVIVGVLLLIVLALLVPPYINVNRYRLRVAHSISRALGREVTVSNIELKLLPRPGMVLANFVVADDPAFSAEPMLRAETVTAYLRLTSLWRGRLEIGTLELDNPSLNLVRRADGHWNLEELVQRTSQVPSAPTAATRPESRPRFPYIEATAGRINFKLGQVKKVFAFTDADFALWLQSENEWGVRLEGRPMRTDIGLSDTGTLNMEGRFQRAAALRNTPLDLKLNFSEGQLGQITKLIYGRDRGWRGATSATATLSGKPAALAVTLDAEVNDFRRYDIALGEALRLRAHCTGTYSSPDDSVTDVVCESPVRSGTIRIQGSAKNWGLDNYEMSVRAEQIPMDRVIAFARHVKKDLPTDLTATGEAEAVFDIHKAGGDGALWEGGGRTSHFALRSNVLKDDVPIGELEFVVPGGEQSNATPKRVSRTKAPPVQAGAGFGILVKPFAIPLGAASPATASGYFDAENYRLELSGDAELTRLMNISNALGIGTPGVGLAGGTEVEMDIGGSWAGFAQPVPAGRLQLHKATAELQGVSEPLLIDSATASLADQAVHVSALSASFAGGPALTGSLTFPVHCTDPETCILHFDLRTNEISLGRVNQLLNPQFSQPWYHLLAIGQRRQDALLRLRANGSFSVAHLQIGSLPANNVSGALAMGGGKVRVDALHADILGGRHDGAWTADFTASPPKFAGQGSVARLAMSQLGSLMHDNWATGAIGGEVSVAMQGLTTSDLRSSAVGSGDFVWSGGSLRHITLEGHVAPMTFSSFAGKLTLKNDTLAIADGKLQAPGANYAVTGSAGFDRQLDFRLERAGGRSYTVTGSLDKPQVEAVPATPAQAQLR